jgi:nucleoside-diphosphate-sugar epimerase
MGTANVLESCRLAGVKSDVSRAQSVLDWKATTDLEAWIKDQIE